MVTPSSRRVKRRKQRFGGAPQNHHRVRDPAAEGTGPQGTPHFAQSLPLYTPTARLKGWILKELLKHSYPPAMPFLSSLQ